MDEEAKDAQPRLKGFKRKAAADLSNKANTIYKRQRIEGFSAEERAVEVAKRNDRANVFYHMRKLKRTEEYQNATATMRKDLEKALRERIESDRAAKGVAALAVQRSILQQTEPAMPHSETHTFSLSAHEHHQTADIAWDDGDPEFEDILVTEEQGSDVADAVAFATSFDETEHALQSPFGVVEQMTKQVAVALSTASQLERLWHSLRALFIKRRAALLQKCRRLDNMPSWPILAVFDSARTYANAKRLYQNGLGHDPRHWLELELDDVFDVVERAIFNSQKLKENSIECTFPGSGYFCSWIRRTASEEEKWICAGDRQVAALTYYDLFEAPGSDIVPQYIVDLHDKQPAKAKSTWIIQKVCERLEGRIGEVTGT